MEKKSFTALFAVVMLLILIPFVPSFIEERFSRTDGVISIPTATATVTATTQQIRDYTAAGYVGEYGYISVPEVVLNPRVLGVSTSRASPLPLYQAEEVGRSNAVLHLKPGQGITVWVDFLNTGRTTWRNDGSHYIALNLTNPPGRQSSFQHSYWKKYYQPARLLQKEVRPGQTGRFRFALQAPVTTGVYLEEFNLVAENLTWIDGGYTRWLIGVGQNMARPPDFQAEGVERSHGGTLALQPGQAMTFWIDFKNTGLQTWYNTDDHFTALNVTDPVGRVSLFKHDFWEEYYYRPTRLLQSRIYPGEVGRFRFAIQAPSVAGYYTEKFALVAENLTWIPGGEFTLSFKIGNPPEPTPIVTSVGEPVVRIGLYNTTERVVIAASGEYKVTDMNTGTETTKAANETTSVSFAETAYWRLVPASADTIMTVTSFENRPVWNSTLNDNSFRGTIELRYSPKTNKLWVINELPLESYLRGLAEVVNGQPEEYLKSLVVAARSYALWHQLRGGKHADEYFDVNATTDQVYRGYGFEQRSTDPLMAAQATSGVVIIHPDAVSQLNPKGVALAPYSSGTDGRTRNWQEVWAGSGYPWIVSVEDPYGIIPNYDTLEGNHMVGMSAQGARGYATQEGKTFDWILKHYYTGVSVEKIY